MQPNRSAASTRILEEAPFPLLLKLASPNALAFLVQSTVTMAEVGFVSQLGTTALAALALIFPGLMLMQMLANGAIGGAVSSAVARALGAGDRARAQNLLWHALSIALGAGILFAATFVLAGPTLMKNIGVSDPVATAAASYGAYIFGGAVLIWAMAMLSSVFRGIGDMQTPAVLMIVGACLQVPLTGALVLGWFGLPRLGIDGAALALLLVSAANALILLLRLLRGHTELKPRLRELRLRRTLYADIFRVGALASLSPLLIVLTITVTNLLVGGFGEAALAGYGIVARVEFLLVPLVFGFGAAMTSMVGINIGAGQRERAARIAWIGGACSAALTGVVGLVLSLAPDLLLSAFTSDPATRAAGAAYLAIVGPVFAFQGLGLSLYFASQGAGHVLMPVVAALIRALIAVGGGLLCVEVLGLGLSAVYACLAAGMFAFGTLTALSVRLGWGRPPAATATAQGAAGAIAD